jgi:hypothetical protein
VIHLRGQTLSKSPRCGVKWRTKPSGSMSRLTDAGLIGRRPRSALARLWIIPPESGC